MLQKLKQKDEDALEWVMGKYAPYVSTIIWNMIGQFTDQADIEELSSDVFFTLWLNAEKVEKGKLKAYLSGVARNKAKERLRSLGREIPLEENTVFIADTDLQEDMEKKEQAVFLRRAILAMGTPDRQIFLRHYYYYQGIEQIAREMNLGCSAVKLRLYRGRQKLKKVLCEGGYFVEKEYIGYDG